MNPRLLNPRRLRLCARLAFGALFLAGAASLAAEDWQSLVKNTPFGQPPAAPTTPAGQIEFRGVVQEDGVYLINLYNPATKTAQWIPVNGKAEGLEVQSYDNGADRVQIVQDGKPLSLTLKQAHVTLVAAAPAAPPPNAENADNPEGGDKDAMAERRAQIREMIRARREGRGPGGSPFMRNMPPEAQAMIEEFRRRRAEAAANQPGPGPVPQPVQR